MPWWSAKFISPGAYLLKDAELAYPQTVASPSTQKNSQSIHQYDLSDVLARLHQRMRLGGFGEREGLVGAGA